LKATLVSCCSEGFWPGLLILKILNESGVTFFIIFRYWDFGAGMAGLGLYLFPQVCGDRWCRKPIFCHS
jgi:hypothetical protein